MTEAQVRAIRSASALLGRELTFVEEFTGGQHASTLLTTDGESEFVVRTFPAFDEAAIREAEILGRLSTFGSWVPHLVTASPELDDPIIITSRVVGSRPPPGLSPMTMATEMAAALARIHVLDGSGLRPTSAEPPRGRAPIIRRAQREWDQLDMSETVLTHSDFWCGNALWEGGSLTGVVDWSGARCGPRGVDVAWCRQDLVLLGYPDAAELFLAEYERLSGRSLDDLNAWDVHAAARAHNRVETWLPNYLGIGWTDITAEVLRERLDSWNATL